MVDAWNTKLMAALRIAALAITVSLFAAAPAYAQDAATEVADTAAEVVSDDEDDGFDWGLLGLLGLLGLGGLMKKRDDTQVTTTRVDRTTDVGR